MRQDKSAQQCSRKEDAGARALSCPWYTVKQALQV